MYGDYHYGVQRVPFGLYIKYDRPIQESTKLQRATHEASALALVQKHTKKQAPRLVELLVDTDLYFLVMTRLPGVPFADAFPFMSYQERAQFGNDLRDTINQFRSIPNPNTAAICNAHGGPVYDNRPRVPGIAGPFDSEVEFNNFLLKYWPSLRSDAHSRKHQTFFTHADLHCYNVLVHAGRLSGIVDFELAGFWPEY